MNKFLTLVGKHNKRITSINSYLMIGFGFLVYALLLIAAGGGISKYHNEVTIIEQLSCNPHSQLCEVVGNVNGIDKEFEVYFDYDATDIHYENCSLILYTWHCSAKLTLKPKRGFHSSSPLFSWGM